MLRPRCAGAFTLIELVMVVVIVGLMSIFAIPNYTKSVTKSYEKVASNNLLIIFAAQKLYYNNSFPNSTYAPPSADVTALNSNLGLSIIDPNLSYNCTSTDAAAPYNDYSCYATRAATFQFRITEAEPPTVCCCTSVGACLSSGIAACASPAC